LGAERVKKLTDRLQGRSDTRKSPDLAERGRREAAFLATRLDFA
jgi:broad specificity phosphatase PhoE